MLINKLVLSNIFFKIIRKAEIQEKIHRYNLPADFSEGLTGGPVRGMSKGFNMYPGKNA
jgi:hypothetical protein